MKMQRNADGFSLVELIITLAIVSTLLVYIAHQYIQQSADRFQTIAADQMAVFANGLNTYVGANNAALAACATTTVSCAVTVAQLQAANDLPNTFATTNVYGQTYLAKVLKDAGGNLLPLAVTTGGTAIPDNDVRTIAAKITTDGAEGGYVSVKTPTVAQGAYGSWGAGVTLASWGLAPGAGHIADALFVRNAAIADDYLHRHATAGQPQLNQMNTAIDMNTNPLNNVTAVNIPGGGNGINLAGSYLYGDTANMALRPANGNVYIQNATGSAASSIVQVANITGSGQFSANTLVAASNVSAGGNALITGNVYGTQGVYTQNVYVGSNIAGGPNGYNSNIFTGGTGGWENTSFGGGWFMQDATWVRSYNNKNVYTGGLIEGGTITSIGRLDTNEYLEIDGLGAIGGGCAPDGLVARASNGSGLVQCVAGTWGGFGAYKSFQIVMGPLQYGFANSFATCPAGYTLLSGGSQITVNPYGQLPGAQSYPVNTQTWLAESTDSRVGVQAYAYCGK